MTYLNSRHRALALGTLLPIVLMVATIAGCSDGRPRRVPVSGQVLIDGKPLTYGFIRLTPDNARPAMAQLGPEGRFILKTFEDGDGVVPGVHPVTIAANEPLSETQLKWHAPKKYADPKTSGLTVTVDKPTDSLVIQLTWAGGKPFVERTE